MNLTVVERKTRLIGAIMVERGLLTPSQLRAALEVQADRGGLLGEIVMAEFGVSRAEVSHVIAEQLAELEAERGSERSSAPALPQLRVVGRSQDGEAHLPVGDALLELGLVSRDQIDSAHEVQRETGERLGEILVGQGVISRLELADALSEHWSSLTKLRAPGALDAPVEAAAPAQIPAGELEALAGAVEGVVARLEASIADRDRELTGHFERLSSRFDEVALLHQQAEARLEAVVAAQEVVGVSRVPAGESEELTGQFERLSSRLDEFVGGRDRELAGQFERLSARVEELVGGDDPELVARLEGFSSRFDALALLHEQTEARFEAIVAAQEAGASGGSAAQLEALAGHIARLEERVAGRDRELATQFERLSERLDELADGRDQELTGQVKRLSSQFDEAALLHEQTQARLEAIAAAPESGASQGSAAEFEALAAVMETMAAGLEAGIADRDRQLTSRFEQLSSQLDEVVAGQAEALVERITSLDAAQRRGEELLGRLVE